MNIDNWTSEDFLQEGIRRLMASQRYKRVIAEAKKEIEEATEFSANVVAFSTDIDKVEKWTEYINLLKDGLKDLCVCQLEMAENNCQRSQMLLQLALNTERISASKNPTGKKESIGDKYSPLFLTVFTTQMDIREMSRKLNTELDCVVNNKSSNTKDGCVYFLLGRKSKRLKIGHSFHVPSRVKALQSSSPEELVVIKTIPGSQQLETRLHKKFAHLRLHGEWFRATTEIMEYIQSL